MKEKKYFFFKDEEFYFMKCELYEKGEFLTEILNESLRLILVFRII